VIEYINSLGVKDVVLISTGENIEDSQWRGIIRQLAKRILSRGTPQPEVSPVFVVDDGSFPFGETPWRDVKERYGDQFRTYLDIAIGSIPAGDQIRIKQGLEYLLTGFDDDNEYANLTARQAEWMAFEFVRGSTENPQPPHDIKLNWYKTGIPALKELGQLIDDVEPEEDQLRRAIELAISGNRIGTSQFFGEDPEEFFPFVQDRVDFDELSQENLDPLLQRLKQRKWAKWQSKLYGFLRWFGLDWSGERILFILDNVGEDITDLVLIRLLMQMGHKVLVVAKDKESLNDTTYEDARYLFSHEQVKNFFSAGGVSTPQVINSGTSTRGTILGLSTPALKRKWKWATLIWDKGEGNGDTIPEKGLTRDRVNTLLVKSSLESSTAGLERGTGVIRWIPTSKNNQKPRFGWLTKYFLSRDNDLTKLSSSPWGLPELISLYEYAGNRKFTRNLLQKQAGSLVQHLQVLKEMPKAPSGIGRTRKLNNSKFREIYKSEKPTLGIFVSPGFDASLILGFAAHQILEPEGTTMNIVFIPSTIKGNAEFQKYQNKGIAYARMGFLVHPDGTLYWGQFPNPIRIDMVSATDPDLLKKAEAFNIPVLNSSELMTLQEDKPASKAYFRDLDIRTPGGFVYRHEEDTDDSNLRERVRQDLESLGVEGVVVKPTHDLAARGVTIRDIADFEEDDSDWFDTVVEDLRSVVHRFGSAMVEPRVRSFYLEDDSGNRLDWNIKVKATRNGDVSMYVRMGPWGKFPDEVELVEIEEFFKRYGAGIVWEQVKSELKAKSLRLARELNAGVLIFDYIFGEDQQLTLLEMNGHNIGSFRSLAQIGASLDDPLSDSKEFLVPIAENLNKDFVSVPLGGLEEQSEVVQWPPDDIQSLLDFLSLVVLVESGRWQSRNRLRSIERIFNSMKSDVNNRLQIQFLMELGYGYQNSRLPDDVIRIADEIEKLEPNSREGAILREKANREIQNYAESTESQDFHMDVDVFSLLLVFYLIAQLIAPHLGLEFSSISFEFFDLQLPNWLSGSMSQTPSGPILPLVLLSSSSDWQAFMKWKGTPMQMAINNEPEGQRAAHPVMPQEWDRRVVKLLTKGKTLIQIVQSLSGQLSRDKVRIQVDLMLKELGILKRQGFEGELVVRLYRRGWIAEPPPADLISAILEAWEEFMDGEKRTFELAQNELTRLEVREERSISQNTMGNDLTNINDKLLVADIAPGYEINFWVAAGIVAWTKIRLHEAAQAARPHLTSPTPDTDEARKVFRAALPENLRQLVTMSVIEAPPREGSDSMRKLIRQVMGVSDDPQDKDLETLLFQILLPAAGGSDAELERMEELPGEGGRKDQRSTIRHELADINEKDQAPLSHDSRLDRNILRVIDSLKGKAPPVPITPETISGELGVSPSEITQRIEANPDIRTAYWANARTYTDSVILAALQRLKAREITLKIHEMPSIPITQKDILDEARHEFNLGSTILYNRKNEAPEVGAAFLPGFIYRGLRKPFQLIAVDLRHILVREANISLGLDPRTEAFIRVLHATGVQVVAFTEGDPEKILAQEIEEIVPVIVSHEDKVDVLSRLMAEEENQKTIDPKDVLIITDRTDDPVFDALPETTKLYVGNSPDLDIPEDVTPMPAQLHGLPATRLALYLVLEAHTRPLPLIIGGVWDGFPKTDFQLSSLPSQSRPANPRKKKSDPNPLDNDQGSLLPFHWYKQHFAHWESPAFVGLALVGLVFLLGHFSLGPEVGNLLVKGAVVLGSGIFTGLASWIFRPAHLFFNPQAFFSPMVQWLSSETVKIGFLVGMFFGLAIVFGFGFIWPSLASLPFVAHLTWKHRMVNQGFLPEIDAADAVNGILPEEEALGLRKFSENFIKRRLGNQQETGVHVFEAQGFGKKMEALLSILKKTPDHAREVFVLMAAPGSAVSGPEAREIEDALINIKMKFSHLAIFVVSTINSTDKRGWVDFGIAVEDAYRQADKMGGENALGGRFKLNLFPATDNWKEVDGFFLAGKKILISDITVNVHMVFKEMVWSMPLIGNIGAAILHLQKAAQATARAA